jgi:uncharacterized protein
MASSWRLVLDTNVVISAALFAQSKPRQALNQAQERGTILMSDATFLELSEVILRSKFERYATLSKRKTFLEDFRETVQFVEVTEQIYECRDAKDNKYLELASSGNAGCIITGDDDLLVLNPFREIKILTIQEFLESNLNR